MGRENRYTDISNNRTSAGEKGVHLKLALRCRHSLEGRGKLWGGGEPVAPWEGVGWEVSRLPDRDMYGGVPAKANFQSSCTTVKAQHRVRRGHIETS